MVTFEYMSNVKTPIFSGNADILIIAGNVGKFDVVLKEATLKYLYVFWILGNTDYWGLEFDPENITNNLNTNFPYPNYKFLEKESFDIGNIRILGATLWKEIPINKLLKHQHTNIDYIKIKNYNVTDTVTQYYKTLVWFQKEFKRAKKDNKKVVVVTHFPPKEIKNDIIHSWIYGKGK
jgi:predicted phosphohydrolase